METKNWKEFRYDEIFEIKKGKRLTIADQINGDIPYISSSGLNNGVDNYIDNGYTDKNCISFACYGSIGEVFYHSGKVWISDNANAIYVRGITLNKYISMFLLGLFYREQYRFSYGMTAKKDRLKTFKIKLPINEQGKPDWQWIENYVKTLIPKLPKKAKSVWNKTFDPTPLSNNKLFLNTDNWKWFEVKDLFNVKKGNTILSDNEKGGDIPLISSTAYNNGTAFFAKKDNIPFDSNKITIASNGSVGSTFYQASNFYATADTNILTLKDNLNPYLAMFLTAIIEKEKYRYNYGRKFGKALVEQSKIKLPVTKDGSPDWQFMEDYIKSLPYSKCL